MFQETGGGSDSGGDSGDSDSGGSGGIAAQKKVVTLTDPKQADLQTALNSDADEVNFSANNGATAAAPGGLELNAPLTVPRDKTLNLTSGRLYNNSSLDVQGTLTVSQGAFLNNHDNGRITGTGTININGNDGLTNYSAGTVSFDGTINMNSGATVNNNGSMTINGSLNVSGGEVHNRNVFMVSGTANLTGVDWFNNYTGGTLTISGTMNVGADAVLNNDGGVVNVTSTSSLHIYGLMTNQGVLNVGTSGAPGAPGRVYVAGKGRLEYYRSTTSDGRNIVVNIARGSTLEITGELKISSALHFEVKPTGSFIITKDTAQNVQVEVAGSQWNVPLGSDGMYSYTNESSSEAGVSVTAASAPGGSAVVSTLNELETALGDTAGAATVTLSGSTPVSVSGSGSDLTVPTGKNLIIESGGTLEITNGGTLTVNGTVTVKVNGELYIGGITTPGTTAGTMTVNGTVTVEENGFLGNKGTVEVLSNSGLQINGTMDNYGTLQIGADGTRGRVDISSTGSFNGTGNITLYKDSTIRVAAETGLELSISRDGSDWTLEHNAGTAYSYTVAATAQVKLQRPYTVQYDFSGAYGYTVKVEKAGGQPLNSGDKVYTGDRVTVTATRDQVSGDPTYKSGVMNFDYLQLYNDIGLIGKLNSPDGDKSYDCMFSVSSYPGSDTLKLILRGIQWTFGGTGSIDATGALVANALNDPAVGTVNVNAWDTTTIKGITTATTVHDGQTLNLNDACVIQNTGTLTVGLGAQVTFGGDMVVSNDGKLNLSGGSMILSNVNANLFIAPSGTVNLSGSILQVAKISPHTNGNGGIFHWTGGTIKCQNGTSLVESGINLTYDVGQTLPTTPTSSDGEWYTWELG